MEHRQVRRLDDPKKIFFFGSGQVFAFMIFFCIGGMADSPLIGGAIGVIFAWGLGSTSSKYHRAFWRHVLYWFTPGRLGLEWMPDSFRRMFVK